MSETKIRTARLKLFLADKPDFAFFGHLSSNLAIAAKPGIGTMATDGRSLFYEPAFVDSLPMEQLEAVIIHEVLHCAGRHHERRNGRDGEAWNIACDATINPTVRAAGLTLPADCIWPADFGLPEGQAAEWYYERLPKGGTGGGESCGKVLDAPPKAPGGDAESGDAAGAIDWDTATAQAACYAQARGTLSAAVARLVGAVLAPATPWQEILADWFTHQARNDYSWTKPNRRFVSMGIYLPSLHSVELGEVVLLVDCSGSIDQRTLDLFAGHLESILSMAPVRLRVVYHDVDVSRVDEWTASDGPLKLTPSGCGGTSHRECFAWILANAPDAVGAVFLTDLYSDVESLEPLAIPTVWACTTDRKAPWGTTIQIGGAA